jgi:hypothetical protein
MAARSKFNFSFSTALALILILNLFLTSKLWPLGRLLAILQEGKSETEQMKVAKSINVLPKFFTISFYLYAESN